MDINSENGLWVSEIKDIKNKLESLDKGMHELNTSIHNKQIEFIREINGLEKKLDAKVLKMDKDFSIFKTRVYVMAAFLVVAFDVLTKIVPNFFPGG